MNIRFYETFILLVKLGNFSRTAEQMNATQPAINGRINALEDYFNVKLYDKGKKPFQLTPEGKVVFQYAKRIVDLDDELKASLTKREFSGTIRIGAIEIVTIAWLPDFIRKLQSECQGINVEITTGTVAELVPRLKNDEFEIVFVVGGPHRYDVDSVNLCTFAMGWFANPRYFNVTETLDVRELSNFPIVLSSQKTSTFPYIKEYFSLHGVEDVFLDTQSVKVDCVTSVPTALSMVKSGLGVMPAPTALLLNEMRAGDIARLPVRQELPSVHVSACFKGKNRSPMIEQVLRIARECAGDYAKTVPERLVWT
ncbi:LysR family transcriptional regulator [Sphingobium sp. CECT 9361]|uniref:LysR family transcriptional regulator n=1 Tax=Sphingobium sp. CECT 9361 TaxID=2845384 RepID=UPI001E5C7A8E|nr:LysR family transcriptional regulator [Sphingobium sp. CECT 9361]CAH0354230.1 HTH-type transcriptional regulator HdfR [Sphingobium sp. CECT 9361]